VPVKLHTSLSVDRDATVASGGSALAKFKLQGSAGVFRLDLQGDAGGSSLGSTDPAWLGASRIRLTGLVDAADGGALVDLLGLDRLVTVNQRSGRLALELNGPLDGDVAVKGQLLAGGLDVSANGTVQPLGNRGPTAQIALKAAAADIVPLRFAAATRSAQPPWSTLAARLMLADSTITFADLDGTLAGVAVKGALGIGMAEPVRINGDITIAALDLPAAIGATIRSKQACWAPSADMSRSRPPSSRSPPSSPPATFAPSWTSTNRNWRSPISMACLPAVESPATSVSNAAMKASRRAAISDLPTWIPPNCSAAAQERPCPAS
jgi:hypothetical protein